MTELDVHKQETKVIDVHNEDNLRDKELDKGDGLLPCPFCGEKDSPYVKYDSSTDDCWQVECGYCCGSAPTAYSKQEAIKEWNTRAPYKEITTTQKKFDVAVEALEFYAKYPYKEGLVYVKKEDVSAPINWETVSPNDAIKPVRYSYDKGQIAKTALNTIRGEVGYARSKD